MFFEKLSCRGVYIVDIEPHMDARGFFARSFCENEFAAAGLVSRFAQSSISFNQRRGTVRGMHFAAAPHEEVKLVRCTRGEIHDVIVDIDPGSATYLQSVSIQLSAENRRALYLPPGFAHGFQTLREETEVLYMIDQPFAPNAARGIRWNDSAIHVKWPEPVTEISQKDMEFPDWTL
jgi:dTDP-4-dehydrorhamnose 3,5-epimerase